MSLDDGEMHAMAGVGCGLITAACTFLLIASSWEGCAPGAASASDEPPIPMEAIEASIAYKKTPAKQPQKRTRRPDPVKPVTGAAHQDDKPPEPKQPDDKKPDDKKPAKQDDFKIPDRTADLDLPVNDKPPTDVGEFNDNTRGFAEVTSGHPFFRELAADFHDNFKFPEILTASDTAAGCLHILATGKIAGTKVEPRSSNPELNDAIERALDAIEKQRNQTPKPVPDDLLAQATTRWICFRAKL